jgi:hypothetical protein
MFTKNSINKGYILVYLNYRRSPNMGISGSDILTINDFEVVDGRTHNDENTINIQPITGKFIPFTVTETYYKDVILYVSSIERNNKIDKIIK